MSIFRFAITTLAISSFAIANMSLDEDIDVATIDDIPLSARTTGKSFSKSKRLLALRVYRGHQRAFYSNCKYRIIDKKLVPLLGSCKYKYRVNIKRAKRIEWEHVVPAWHFGHQLQCWKKGGRRECSSKDKKFREMEADMHNLVPAIGEINGDRSNYKYHMIAGEPRPYGENINMEISFKSRVAEPPDNVYGDIARIYFYMRDKYGLKLSKAQEKLFIAWNNMDPVDKWELEKNKRVKSLQGDDNSYVSNYRKMKQLGDIEEDKPVASDTEEPKSKTDSSTSQSEFNELKDEIERSLSFIFKYIPQPFSTILLILITVVIFYIKKRFKK